MTEYGAGWIMGGGGPEAFTAGADQARRAWREAGRAGALRLAALIYADLGDDAEAHARAYLTDYDSFTGDYADRIAASALTSAQKVADTVAAFTDAGCDELILFPPTPTSPRSRSPLRPPGCSADPGSRCRVADVKLVRE